MIAVDQRSDRDLLCDGSAEDFAVVYRRHVETVLRHCARLGLSAQDGADLTSETFAAALVARRRYRDENPTAAPWLLTIASRRATDRLRRFSREQRALRRLKIESATLTEADIAEYDALRDDDELTIAAADALRDLPDSQREAVTARVLDEREYHEISLSTRTAEPAVRQRVHRGLATLRQRLTEPQ